MPVRFKTLTLIFTLLAVVLFNNSFITAAENVRLIDNLDDSRSLLTVKSSTQNKIELNLDIEAVRISPDTKWGNNYQQAELPRGDKLVAGKISAVGEPDLPVLTTMIGIPDMAGVTISASYESFEIIDDIDLIPTQEAMPEKGFEGPQAFSKNMTVYNQNRFYPEVLAEAAEPVIMRDIRMVQIAVYPMHYNPVTRQMKIYRNITVDISYDGEVINPKTTRCNYISEAFYPLYKSLIANFDSYMATLSSLEIKRGGVLIITPDFSGYSWADNMQEIADWKRQKGYDVVLSTTHDVDPGDGRPSYTQVKTFIQTAYNTWDEPPEFIYLVGDEDRIIPDYPYGGYASDHQYSRLDGSDFLPDAAVCRVSVDSENELNAWIAKVMKYEKDPDMMTDPQYWRRAIMVAGGQQTETCVWTVKWAKERLEQHGFVQVDTVFDEGWDPPDSYITNPITAGVGYVNYRGWAGSSGWYDPSYNTSALNQCNNINKPGIMTSIVCGTGNFGASGYDPCFGEVWIRMGSASSPKGGPCFFGCTDGGTHTRWNNPISFGFYFALLERDIYHFGTAVIASKLTQYSNFPRHSSTVQKYFHTYNMLGDPELEMRLATPSIVRAEYPSTIEKGINNIRITANDAGNHPIVNAYVTLIMRDGDDEAFFSVGKTDNEGYTILDVPTDTTGELLLTISGRDLKPLITTIDLTEADEAVALNTFTIDDDNSGSSNGNNDSELNPTECIELTIELKNFGISATAENITAQLISADESAAIVHSGVISYGNLAPGETSTGDFAFIATIQPASKHDDNAAFLLEVVSDAYPDGWTSAINIPIIAAKFEVADVNIDGNGRLDPNENVQMTIELTNTGGLDAEGVSGILQTADGYVHAVITEAEFGDIDIGETAENDGTPISVSVDAGTFEGRNIPFVLTLTSAGGAVYQTNFDLTVGSISVSDPSGPDAYGYYAYDNLDTSYPEHPEYSWTSIHSLGTNLYQSDDDKDLISLPFDFVYYGDTYDRITVCSNGWICMDSTQWVGFRNWRMPDPSYAQAMIAGFWDDLGPSGSNNVYTYYDSDNHRYIIEWYNIVHRDYTYIHETFQIILYDPAYTQTITGDGVIDFIYYDITNCDSYSGENYATIGWEDMTELIGFTISYSNIMSSGCANLSDGRVYRITTNTGRGAVSGTVTVNNGDETGVIVEASTGQWLTVPENGEYSLREIPAGLVDITFSKPGWFPQALVDVAVTVNSFTDNQDAALEQCPIPGSFTASENLGDHIHLSWGEVIHSDIDGYDIYRGRFDNGIYTKLNDTPVEETSYDDFTSEDNIIYWYYVMAVFSGDDYEAVSLASNKAIGSNNDITGIEDEISLPATFTLSQNYPNPFNGHTVINYTLPADGHVSLEVFNILGQNICIVCDGYQQAGYKSIIWNGVNNAGNEVASGMYFYRLSSSSEQATRRMLLLK